MLSIIIPVYNLEKFVVKCLESLENQTNNYFETIIINDGSTDNSLGIIEDFLKKTSIKNVRLFSTSNKGVSEARNLGIRESSGDYLLFLDGDDYIESSLVETIYMLKNNYDIIFFNHNFVDETEYSVIKSSVNKLDKDSFSNECFIRNHLLTTRYFNLWIGSIVFSKRLLSSLNLQFISKLQTGEDTNFISKCFLLAKKIKYIDMILSNYVQRSGSVTKRYNIRRFDSVYSYIDVANFISENSYQIEPEYINRILNKFYYLSIRSYIKSFFSLLVYFEDDTIKSRIESLMSEINQNYPLLEEEIRRISSKSKLEFTFFHISTNIIYTVFKISPRFAFQVYKIVNSFLYQP